MSDKHRHPMVSVPVTLRGNYFMRGDERFLIKGISYNPRYPPTSNNDGDEDRYQDPLASTRLDDLKKDIPLLHELGLNAISVTSLHPSNDHSGALKLLEDAGIYVLVKVLTHLHAPRHVPGTPIPGNSASDPQSLYTLASLKPTLELVDELADHPNVLAVTVSADAIGTAADTRLAPIVRACVRDIKNFLRLRGGRQIPVGATTGFRLMVFQGLIQYLAAGEPVSRADFFGHDCWTWAGPNSSFQISGWKNMVEMVRDLSPIPMLLAAYGTNIHKPRTWEEVKCLYSPDMTGTYSGGFAHTYFENRFRYGVVEAKEGGERKKRAREFDALGDSFREVNARATEEVMVEHARDYEGWRGDFPEAGGQGRWPLESGEVIPEFPGDMDRMVERVTAARRRRGRWLRNGDGEADDADSAPIMDDMGDLQIGEGAER